MESFLFVAKDVRFEETSPDNKFIRVSATFLELDKPSIGSEAKISKIYRFEEGKKIADSLVGKTVYYGTDWAGRHTDKHEIGIVEKAVKLGKRIKGIIKVWINDANSAIVESLKKGGKFLFSVGGVAQFGKLIEKGGKHIQKLFNSVCTHLQMVPSGTPVGFPSAKLEEIIEIQETVVVCEGDVCPILQDIKTCYGESCKVCSTPIPVVSETETLISDEEIVLEGIKGFFDARQNKQNN